MRLNDWLEMIPPKALDLSVGHLKSLRPQARQALRRARIRKVSDFQSWPDDALLHLHGFGPASLQTLHEDLRALTISDPVEAEKAPNMLTDSTPVPENEGIPPVADAQWDSSEELFGVSDYSQLLPDRPLFREEELAKGNRQALPHDAQVLWAHIASGTAELDLLSARVLELTMLAHTREPMPREAASRELEIPVARLEIIEQGIHVRIGLGPVLRDQIDARLNSLRPDCVAPLLLAHLERLDPWFEGCVQRPNPTRHLLRIVESEFAVFDGPDGPFVSLRKAGDLRDLRRRFERHWDRAVTPPSTSALEQIVEMEQAAVDFLENEGISELIDLFVLELSDRVLGLDRAIVAPTLQQRVEAVVRVARRPMTITQVESRMLKAGMLLRPGTVRAAMERADLYQVGDVFMLASDFRHLKRRQAKTLAAVFAVMADEPEADWSSAEILEELIESRLVEIHEATPVFLGELMRDCAMVERCGEDHWRLAGRDEVSESIHQLALQVVDKNGKPLRRDLLEMAVRRFRPDVQVVPIRWPLVRLPNRLVALGPRDLRVTSEMRRKLRRELREGRRGDATPDLSQLWLQKVDNAPELDAAILTQLAGL